MEFNDTDFQYVLQDFSNVYIGGRNTYEMIANADDTPSDFFKVVRRVICHEVSEETILMDHLINLDKESESYLVFKQLKARIKVVFFNNPNSKKEFLVKEYRIDEFLDNDFVQQEKERLVVQEVYFKKINLGRLKV